MKVIMCVTRCAKIDTCQYLTKGSKILCLCSKIGDYVQDHQSFVLLIVTMYLMFNILLTTERDFSR